MANKSKLLFSTKISQNHGSDMIGGSIMQILLADFYRAAFGFKVSLHDPFFNTQNILEHNFIEVLNIISAVKDFDRIANCQFYFGNNSYKNKIKINIERQDLINKYLPLKERDIYTFRDHAMYQKQENIHHKFLDMPYIYQCDLMYKLRYRPGFKSIKNHIQTNKNVYGVHIRQKHWKIINSRNEDNLIDFYVKIFEKIKSDNSLIIYYGSFNDELESRIKKFNVINGNTFSEYPLERALLLSRVNHSISSINGFSLFSNYLALSNNNLNKVTIINDVQKISEITHLRRIYSKGLLEDRVGKTGFYSKFKIYPNYSVLKYNFELNKNEFTDFQQGDQIKPRLIFFKSEYLQRCILSPALDNILIENIFLDALAKGFNACYFDATDILESDVYVLTHYNFDIRKNKNLGTGSLDFNKPKILNSMDYIGPDQMFYEDVLHFLYRAKLEELQPSNKVDKVAFIGGYKMAHVPSAKWSNIFNYILRLMLVEGRAKKVFNFFKRKILNTRIENDLNPLNLDENIYAKFNFYSAAEIEMQESSSIRSTVELILSDHDRVICEPSSLSLVFSALDKYNKVILFTEKFKGFDLPVSTFSDEPLYKITDFFPIHFDGFSELRIHLKSFKFIQ